MSRRKDFSIRIICLVPCLHELKIINAEKRMIIKSFPGRTIGELSRIVKTLTANKGLEERTHRLSDDYSASEDPSPSFFAR
jgi:hypothetical protein